VVGKTMNTTNSSNTITLITTAEQLI